MRNTPLDQVDDVPRDVLPIGTDYATGEVLTPHRHRRAQLLYGATGVMHVETDDGSWVVPTHRAVWIPPETVHQVTMYGVSTCSLYIEPAAAPWGPATCEVVTVSPLARQLLLEAADLPVEYDEHGRDGALVRLLLFEVSRMTPLPLHVPLPSDRALLAMCRAFLDEPDAHASPVVWAAALHVSLRTFNRRFGAQTGLTFDRWRQRACVLAALPRLSAGESVTRVAGALGYESPAAFSTMFRRVLDASPHEYLGTGARPSRLGAVTS
ncbi:helix-turn-helix domain-containing protein [Oerskovia sp. Root22]|uniref:AraC family transcriptional regulator n=1 Tax=Oerskovia sp. Root22 TaxID=1736494 RepID=UPI0006FA95AF|nr:helix-turn-helix transcriptional regulator [Oerskovia sp. Root22]KRC31675.1 AraC family transcriptional regulator [Oerskovia sp. Root22]